MRDVLLLCMYKPRRPLVVFGVFLILFIFAVIFFLLIKYYLHNLMQCLFCV